MLLVLRGRLIDDNVRDLGSRISALVFPRRLGVSLRSTLERLHIDKRLPSKRVVASQFLVMEARNELRVRPQCPGFGTVEGGARHVYASPWETLWSNESACYMQLG